MQQFFIKFIIEKWQKRVAPPVSEPTPTQVEQGTRYQDTLSHLTRHTWDAKAVLLHRAMDIAG